MFRVAGMAAPGSKPNIAARDDWGNIRARAALHSPSTPQRSVTRPKARRRAGYSLTELLLTLALIALLLSLPMPDLREWRSARQSEDLMRELLTAIELARASAVDHNLMVTFCPSPDGLRCQGSRWGDGGIIFLDADANRRLDGKDRLLLRLEPMSGAGTLKFRSFGNRQFLQMTPRGFTNYQNGNFTWCPPDGDARKARQIIVSLSGRSRMARDSDGDGIIENSQGKAVEC